ncbi:glycoside hydrolase family 3 C-terminal domain-containing protein [Konateibacter massiliensis]|uniref:glycoside hydrolase family 3 C-terminal domain-containing protein n=1 Tax=Konateibacter massiliensis TaxID=2002841 RepID=UPI000C15D833|nr:glycoside hydrolase family 3 C-terminal domain-containing protein [Konateibacter massiliensis]
MKHTDLIEKMTLEEKAAFLSGKGEWETREFKRHNLPSIFCSDGPHGLRKQAGAGDHLGLNESLPATCFPTAATVANSWDESLGQEIGDALGEEAEALDVDILLGPGLNIKRSPLCGRNFEYFSEDPYLAGKMAASYVKGIQSHNVYACPKHFAVNSQELRRMAMNSVLDERTLREIYLTGFEIAVKEGGAKAIMSSYNEVNGEYANENKHLLTEILREEWGFDGMVVTDWGGSNNHVKGVAAGSNLEMPAPGLDSAREIVAAVNDGTLSMEELDFVVDGLLDAVLTLGKRGEKKDFDKEAHHKLARKAAAESAVLLKNEKSILPLKSGVKVALIGDFAVEPRYQGAGSSVVNPTQVETLEKIINHYDVQVVGTSRGYHRMGEANDAMKKEAMDIAALADVVLFCFGLDEISESEGLDRNHMRIPQNQIDLLQSMAQLNTPVVGIISAGSSIEMPWQNSCQAILHGYLTGQAGASAMMDILMGKVNPSGRLNETYPIRYEDTPAFRHFPSTERNAEFRESIYVGYRYYDSSKVRVQYPFGFGLSYTEFTYSDLSVDVEGASVTIANTGNCDGAEVVQMYIGLDNAIVFRPAKELKGFKKVFLKAGEQQTIRIPFDDKTFRYWNVKTNKWEIEMGTYQVMIGASVSDIRLEADITVEGTTNEYPYNPALLPYYYTGIIQQISDKEFEELLGHPIPSGKWSGELGENDAICQMYYAKSKLARFIYNRLTAMKIKSEEKGKPDLNILFIYNMPFRALAKMTAGMISMEMVEGMLVVVNGHFFKGLGKIIGGFFRNRRKNKAYEKKLAGGNN